MIAGYCWPQSGRAGDTITFFLHSDLGPLDVSVYRVGIEETKMKTWPKVAVEAQPIPEDAAVSGCDWSDSLVLVIPDDWPPGFYRVDLSAAEQTSEAFFVVKAAQNSSLDAVLVLSTSTWAAYNDWGGPSYYTGGVRVSMHRPLPNGFLKKAQPERFRLAQHMDWSDRDGADFGAAGYSPWSMAAGWSNWETLFVRWAEANNLRLGYGVSQDLIFDRQLLDDVPLYLSVGHDEYWSAEMRDRVEQFIEHGGNAAFFSGNTAFWQARYENDGWVCYKMTYEADPQYRSDHAPNLSTMWSDPLVGRPENNMTGVSFTRGGYAHMRNSPRGSGGYQVWRPDHWAFHAADLGGDNDLGADAIVVGYECDGCEIQMRDGLPTPTGAGGTPTDMEILATAPARLWETEHLPEALREDYVGELNWVAARLGSEDNHSNRTLYGDGHAVMATFKKGAGSAFTTGCTDWAYGLTDPAVSQVTHNVIKRFSTRRAQR